MGKRRKPYPRRYIVASVLFIVFSFIYMTMSNIVYINGRRLYLHGVT